MYGSEKHQKKKKKKIGTSLDNSGWHGESYDRSDDKITKNPRVAERVIYWKWQRLKTVKEAIFGMMVVWVRWGGVEQQYILSTFTSGMWR